MIPIKSLMEKYSTIGVVGNASTGKTALVLGQLLQIKKKYPKTKIAVMGVNEELHTFLEKQGVTIIHSKMDILDLQMNDTIIFIDEMAMFFKTNTQSKQLDKLSRFFDRIEHLNCKIIIGTARAGYFNKFMCGRITAFIVKQIEYSALVNGSWLKERVEAITSNSDYRMVAQTKQYYIITSGDSRITTLHTFPYNKDLDTKKDNKKFFE